MNTFVLKLILLISCLSLFTMTASAQTKYEKAVFAGGCFWCMTPPFENTEGVLKAVAGYTGGKGADPDYRDYAQKGHIEAVEITYDPARVSYPQLLDVFWRQVNPTDNGGQFCDRGPQYRSAIFVSSDEQRRQAEKSKEVLTASRRYDQPIVTGIIAASTFYPAEEYHQDYHKKNPLPYKFYRFNCGRDRYLDKIWGPAAGHKTQKEKSPLKDGLRNKLTPLQYRVTQENGTEPPFQNEYWNNKKEGIYVDIVSGDPLFSSLDKYDSRTGWPSFTQPIERGNIVEKKEKSLFMTRTEVRSTKGDSHLGHVFDDGPAPTGLRYCLNSAALKFIAKEDLEKEGYGQYLPLFNKGP